MFAMALMAIESSHLSFRIAHLSHLSPAMSHLTIRLEVCLTLQHMNPLLKLSLQMTSSESFPHKYIMIVASADLSTS